MVNHGTLVKIMASHDTWNACQDHDKIMARSWQDHGKIMARSWQDLGKITMVRHVNFYQWYNLFFS